MPALQLSHFATSHEHHGSLRRGMGSSGSERRRFPRIDTWIDGRVYADYQYTKCTILDLSENGARLRPRSVFIPNSVSVQFPGLGTVAGNVVWRRKGQVGLKFHTGPGDVCQAVATYLDKVHMFH